MNHFGTSSVPPPTAKTYQSHQYADSLRAVNATRSTLTIVVVLVALLLNWLLLLSGPTRALGLYSVFIYLLLLYVVDLALEQMVRSGVGCLTNGMRLEPASHIHYSPLNNAISTYIGVWIVWWLAAHLLFEAGLVFTHDWWRALLLLTSLVSSLGSASDDYTLQCIVTRDTASGPADAGVSSGGLFSTCGIDFRKAALSFAPDVFCLLFLFALAFPSAVWLPQTTTAVVGVVRVGAYFLGVLLADFLLPTTHMTEEQAHKADAYVRAMSNVERQLQPTLMSSTFCAIVLEYDRVRGANRRRARRVVATSAWVLVVAPLTAIIFAVFMIIVQTTVVAMRKSTHVVTKLSQQQLPQQQQQQQQQQQYSTDLEAQHNQTTSASQSSFAHLQQQQPSIMHAQLPVAPVFVQQSQPLQQSSLVVARQQQYQTQQPPLQVPMLAPSAPPPSSIPLQPSAAPPIAPPTQHQQFLPRPPTSQPSPFKTIKF